MPINAYWVTVVEVRWYSLDGSCLPLFITPIFILFCLALINLILHKVAPKSAFTQSEMLVIYIMIVIGETLCGHDFVQNLFGVVGQIAADQDAPQILDDSRFRLRRWQNQRGPRTRPDR